MHPPDFSLQTSPEIRSLALEFALGLALSLASGTFVSAHAASGAKAENAAHPGNTATAANAASATHAPSATAPKPTAMNASTPTPTLAKGSFDVTLAQAPAAEGTEAAKLGRMSIRKQFHGDLEGSSLGRCWRSAPPCPAPPAMWRWSGWKDGSPDAPAASC